MAKQDYILRYLTIIKKFRKSKEVTFEELSEHLKSEYELQDRPFSFSVRTFQRDLNEIRDLFKIDIQYNFSTRVYYIADDLQTDLHNRMLESIDTINSLKMVSDVTKYMFFEKRKAKGTHHFYGLLHAIRNRIVINLVHQRYDEEESTSRLVESYALQECKGRWYLLAKDKNDRKIKTFGLDRIRDFENTAQRFDYPLNFDVNEHFRNCFGVINPEGEQPVEIILSFAVEQGKYVKSYPIHESQTIIEDTEEHLLIGLYLFITHDLKMELLSYGDRLRVIAPRQLSEAMITIYQNAMRQYDNHASTKIKT